MVKKSSAKDTFSLDVLASFIAERLDASQRELLQKAVEQKLSAREVGSGTGAEAIRIPVSLFKEDLGPLELCVRYLKDTKRLSFNQISKLLNRKYTTITTTYYNSLAKLPSLNQKILGQSSQFDIPLDILKKDTLSLLEAIVKHLSEHHRLSTRQIAELLDRNAETVKTVKRRLRLKT